MSEEEWTGQGAPRARQFGDEIIEKGDPFTGDTLDAIRALVAEDPVDPVDVVVDEPEPERRKGPLSLRMPRDEQKIDDARPEQIEATSAGSEHNPPKDREWRRLTLVERGPGRWLRRIVSSPRGLAFLMIAAVTLWRPWFIPALALVIILTILLIGVLIGQDRIGRMLLFILKRFVWADPARGRAIQRVLPKKWHPFLYKPLSDDDSWEGPVDPRFEERLARLQG